MELNKKTIHWFSIPFERRSVNSRHAYCSKLEIPVWYNDECNTGPGDNDDIFRKTAITLWINSAEMSDKNYHRVVVIFAESAADRDLYRHSIFNSDTKVFCFEKEATCFDNLETIKPDIIILKTKSQQTLWRFIFAAQTFQVRCYLLVYSDNLDIKEFLIEKIGNISNPFVEGFIGFKDLVKKIHQHPHANHELTLDDGLPAYEKGFLLGGDVRIRTLRRLLPTLIDSSDPVLITGEPGVGKENLIRLIVAGLGHRSVFIKINCADFSPDCMLHNGLLDNLLQIDSTNAEAERDKSESPLVIYFDGIDQLNDAAQSAVLSFLDEAYKYVQKNIDRKFQTVRFIATANTVLNNHVCSGHFKKELYFRLNVIPVSIPTLRERIEDIPILTDYLIINACNKMRTSIISLSHDVMERLHHYGWPQNIKELIGIIERIVHMRDESVLLQENLLPAVPKKKDGLLRYAIGVKAIPDTLEIKNSISNANSLALKSICKLFASRTEKKLMEKALEATNWNRKKAAELLNISYKSMLNKMKMYEIV